MILNSKILSTAILLLYHLTATCQWESSINDHCSRAELRGNSKSRQSSFVDVSIDGTVPNLERIKIATVVTQDINVTKALYGEWLGYRIVEDGMIPKPLANSWGTPEMDGKPYALLQGESGDDVYLRVIQGTLPKGYKAMTTNGWNAIEMIVENPDAIYEKLIDSPFVNLGAPANLGADGISTIRAVQFKGPSEEVFYFTTDTGDRSTSNLLTPRAFVDRPFIMVVAGPSARTLIDFYVSNFGAKESFFIKTPINIVSLAQNLPTEHLFPLGLVRLGAFSNSIEIDGYPDTAGSRPTAAGELPPGVSITSFSINDLNMVDSNLFITEPITLEGIAYKGNRTVTIVGPAGELIELIEEKKH